MFVVRVLVTAEARSLKLSVPQRKAVLAALSESDPPADICEDRHGSPGPDTALRDTETVALGEDLMLTRDAKSCSTFPPLGLITSRRRSATKSPSTATSTSTNRPDPLKSSKPTCGPSKRRSPSSFPKSLRKCPVDRLAVAATRYQTNM